MRWGLTVAVVAVVTLLASAVIWSFRLQSNAERAQGQQQQGLEARAAALERGSRHAHADADRSGANSDPAAATASGDALVARFDSAGDGQRVSVLWEICQSEDLDARRKVTVLCQALNDRSTSVRSFAVSMLGNMGPDAAGAVPALAAALKQPALAVEVCAALGKMGSTARPALPALEALATDSTGALQDAAKGALGKINGR